MELNGEYRMVLTTRCDGQINFDFSGQAHGKATVSVHPAQPMFSTDLFLGLGLPSVKKGSGLFGF